MPKPLRIGTVPYWVGRPLDCGLEEERGVSLEKRVPAQLVEGLRGGELDVALVSSIELFRMPGYTYLPELCVGTRGEVTSVQVFLKRPIDEVRTLALDPASRTSQALVQILLAERPGGAPEYHMPRLGEALNTPDRDAWLSIGDKALQQFHAEEWAVFNPSSQWAATTGLPFVFAAWIVRTGVNIDPYRDLFQSAFERGQERLPNLAAEAGADLGLPPSVLETYLGKECAFRLGDEMQDSLTEFGERAAALGLTDPIAMPVPLL